MVEVHKAQDMETGEKIEVRDAEPLASAIRFKDISDRIWAMKQPNRSSCHHLQSALPPHRVRDALNKVVSEIDQELVISGIGRVLNLGKRRPDEDPIVVNSLFMDHPMGAVVETSNMDSMNSHRAVDVEGQRRVVEFTDGHLDYYRELGAKLIIKQGVVVNYAMQRIQTDQDKPTALALVVHHMDFAETGYEGHHLAYKSVTQEQEMRFLDVIERMAGIESNR